MIAIDSSVNERLPRVRFAWSVYENARIVVSPPLLLSELSQEEEKARASMTVETIAQDIGVMESRRAFRMLGLDPARYRPSQEALLRRIVKGQSIAPINSGVDVCNVLSVRFRVPMGVYDLDHVKGSLQLKVGTFADVYAALNGRDVECSDKLILCDEEGPIGSPYVDSQRTAVDVTCRRCLHLVYLHPAGISPSDFQAMRTTITRWIASPGADYQSLCAA